VALAADRSSVCARSMHCSLVCLGLRVSEQLQFSRYSALQPLQLSHCVVKVNVIPYNPYYRSVSLRILASVRVPVMDKFLVKRRRVETSATNNER